ncbi:hypothetical protein [Streptomyces violaceusniger]|uniref:hypothetical protein n=1 Tax=Streptomyces violaceusniger TaxID=68280 RepID=UPI0001E4CF22|nr:hypothetical protein [Streptomyces violaceusniger]
MASAGRTKARRAYTTEQNRCWFGVMDRFRSLPMARWAVSFGHTGASSLIGLPLLAAMVGTGVPLASFPWSQSC